MILRPYRPEDLPEIAALFYDTVHSVNARDYSPLQLWAWATGYVDLAAWDRRYRESETLIAEIFDKIIGFGNMEPEGYLDMLYVHRDFQHRGVASAICDALEGAHPGVIFTTHASVTARPFFERRGYLVVRRQTILRRGVELTNFVMEKGPSN